MERIGLVAGIEGVPDFLSDVSKMNKAVDSFGDAGGKAGSAFDAGFSDVVIGALHRVGEIAVNALVDAGRAVSKFVGDSVGLAGDFEQGMLEFQAVAGKSIDTKGLQQFHDLFIDIGKRLPVSTTEVQNAAIELVKGGIDPATIAAGGLESSIKFAAAAMDGDLAGAATISAKVVGGWADVTATAAQKADLMTHAQDQMTRAANASTVDVDELARGVFNAQGAFKTAGGTFDDLTVTLAELSPRFASASEAGNSLKNMIARLQPSTKPAIEAMEGLGLITKDGANKFYDAQGSFVGVEQASQLLQDSLKGLTDQQRASILQTIFGNDAMGAASALAENGAAGYQAMAQAMAESNGVAENAAIKQQGYNTALENAKGSVEALQIQLGEKLLPILTDLLNNYIAPGINTLSTFADAVFGNDEAFNQLSPTLQDIVTYIQGVVDGVQGLIDSFNDAGPLSSEFGESIVGLANALGLPGEALQDLIFGVQDFIGWLTSASGGVGLFTDATTEIGRVLTEDVGPILADLGSVILPALNSALQVGASFWENVLLPVLTTVWKYFNDYTIPVLKDVASWLKENLPPAIETVADFLSDTLFPAFKEVWTFLDNNIIPIIKTLVDIELAALGTAISAVAGYWSDTLWPALQKVWSFINSSVIPIIAALVDVNLAALKKASEAMAGLWQNVLQPAFQKVSDFVSNTVSPNLQKLGDWLSTTFGPTLDKVAGWLDKVTGGFGGISEAVDYVVEKLHGFATGIENIKLPWWLTPGSPTPWEIALRGIGDALGTSVTPGLGQMQQGLKDVGAAFGETDLIDQLTELGEDAMDGFAEGLQRGVRGVIRVINSTANTVEGAFRDGLDSNSPAKRIIPIGEGVTEGLMVGIENLMPGLISLIGSTAQAMIDAVTKNKEAASDAINEMADDLISQAEDLSSQIQDAISNSFSSTASIDRQLADNLDKLKNVLPGYQQYVEGALKQAQLDAQQFADPEQSAKFFKMRSAQIMEYEKLRKQLAEENDSTERQRIRERMELINAAQQAEIEAFKSSSAASSNPALDLSNAIRGIFSGDSDLAKKLPGIFDSPFVKQLFALLDQLNQPRSNPWANPTTTIPDSAYATPYASPAQQAAGSQSFTSTTNFNMPIYTNQSPSVMQDSAAIAWAMLT